MDSKKTIRVGDRLSYRTFGSEHYHSAVVTGIEKTSAPWEKYGTPVQSIPADEADCACFDFDDGHWAYGEQVRLDS